MILDKTFCTGIRCNQTESCDRYIGKLREYQDKTKWIDWESEYVSVADFSDHEGKCLIKQYFESSK